MLYAKDLMRWTRLRLTAGSRPAGCRPYCRDENQPDHARCAGGAGHQGPFRTAGRVQGAQAASWRLWWMNLVQPQGWLPSKMCSSSWWAKSKTSSTFRHPSSRRRRQDRLAFGGLGRNSRSGVAISAFLAARGRLRNFGGIHTGPLAAHSKVGDHFDFEGHRFVVEEMEGHRIAKVNIEKLQPAAAAQAGN